MLRADVIAQKLRQTGFPISTRSVERVIGDFGLQKKTLSMPSAARNRSRGLKPKSPGHARGGKIATR